MSNLVAENIFKGKYITAVCQVILSKCVAKCVRAYPCFSYSGLFSIVLDTFSYRSPRYRLSITTAKVVATFSDRCRRSIYFLISLARAVVHRPSFFVFGV